jgi:hypothetical protein
VRYDISVDSEMLLVTDFMNLKIKPNQSFRGTYTYMICVYVFIEISVHSCMSIYVCIIFFKKTSCLIVR